MSHDDEFARAVLLRAEGRLDETDSACATLLARDPLDVRALHLLGTVRFAQNLRDEAIRLVRQAISIHGDYAEAHFNLGAMLAEMDRPAEAAEHYGITARLRPNDAEAAARHGRLLITLGRPDEAEAVLARAVQLRPDDADALTLLGNLMQLRGAHREALDIYRRLATVMPDSVSPGLLIEAAEHGLYFTAQGLQGQPARQVFMAAAISLWDKATSALRLLEIGSYMGASALTWAYAAERFLQVPLHILCVDTWDLTGYAAYPGGMARALGSGDALRIFRNNVAQAPAGARIEFRQGRSRDVMPTLEPAGFDIVYIDGSHACDDVRFDLAEGKRLLREGGLLCGDDLELQGSECDLDHAKGHATSDYIRDPRSGRKFHPGVTLALWDTIGPVSAYDGFWVMRKTAAGYEPVSLRDATGVLPRHWPRAVIEELRQRFAASRELKAVLD